MRHFPASENCHLFLLSSVSALFFSGTVSIMKMEDTWNQEVWDIYMGHTVIYTLQDVGRWNVFPRPRRDPWGSCKQTPMGGPVLVLCWAEVSPGVTTRRHTGGKNPKTLAKAWEPADNTNLFQMTGGREVRIAKDLRVLPWPTQWPRENILEWMGK